MRKLYGHILIYFESVQKGPLISYSGISYFGHTCPKLNFVLFSRLTAWLMRNTKFKKNMCNSSLWTCSHLMAKIKILIF